MGKLCTSCLSVAVSVLKQRAMLKVDLETLESLDRGEVQALDVKGRSQSAKVIQQEPREMIALEGSNTVLSLRDHHHRK